MPGEAGRPATLLLRFEPGEGQFKALTDKITDLNREILLHRRTQLRLEQALAEKEVLLRELHHRVKNNLQLLLGMFALAERAELDERVRRRLRDARLRVESMGIVQKLLFQSQDFAALNIANFLAELCASIEGAYAQPNVTVTVRAAPATLSLEAAVPIGLIVNELVSNALKHAFRGREAGAVQVKFRRDGTRFALVVEDDGVGFDPALATGRSSGLGLVNGLVRQLNGSCRLERANPVCWIVEFTDPGRAVSAQDGR